MASRKGKNVVNININDGGEVLDMLGKGLNVIKTENNSFNESIQIDLGTGLKFDQNKVVVQLGNGLTSDVNNGIAVDTNSLTGSGLTTDNNKIAVNPSDFLGEGLNLESGKVTLDMQSCKPAHEIHVLSDVNIALDGNILSLTKTIQTYNVVKNIVGLVVDVISSHTSSHTETVIIPNGYMSALSTSSREDSELTPNFYVK